jgi:perosamine synthetase
MTNMQAAVGLAQLEQLDELLDQRDHIYNLYKKNLNQQKKFLLQETHGQQNVNWIFTIRMHGVSENQRDAIMADLKDQQIDTRPVFYPIHHMPFYLNDEKHEGKFPQTEIISREGISLPTYIGLTDDDIEYITQSLLVSFEKCTT